MRNLRCEWSLTYLLFPRDGRGLRCELVITRCDKLRRNILCSVFRPSEYLEKSLHAFFMMKKDSGQHWELEELKKNSTRNVFKRDLLR
ncbi:unnamed protein product, partial [Staurois parvus]